MKLLFQVKSDLSWLKVCQKSLEKRLQFFLCNVVAALNVAAVDAAVAAVDDAAVDVAAVDVAAVDVDVAYFDKRPRTSHKKLLRH